MGEKERLNAFEAALNNETREREFYLKNAEGYLLNPAHGLIRPSIIPLDGP